MKKKIFLGLGTLTTVAAPVAMVISCGDDSANDINIDLKKLIENKKEGETPDETAKKVLDDLNGKISDAGKSGKTEVKIVFTKSDNTKKIFRRTNKDSDELIKSTDANMIKFLITQFGGVLTELNDDEHDALLKIIEESENNKNKGA